MSAERQAGRGARSAVRRLSCSACALHLATRGVPCLDHTADSMREVRALAMGLVR